VKEENKMKTIGLLISRALQEKAKERNS